MEAADIVYLPLAAREGANLASRAPSMPWYGGATLLEALDALPQLAPAADLWVQDAYKFDEQRIVAGRIESGQLGVGDTLRFSPSNAVVRVASIERWNTPQQIAAGRGCSVGLTLDEDIFVERG